MNTPDFTLVLGVDQKHFEQLQIVWPTWMTHKPQLRDRPLVVFYDRDEILEAQIISFLGSAVKTVPWPPEGVEYPEGDGTKWTKQQRVKMLSGFVHVAAEHVETPYWLKIDTDTVATSGGEDWLDRIAPLFDDRPAIVSQKWGFTKPADQMLQLDEWAKKVPELQLHEPLRLEPNPGSSRLNHKRIISWCAFFESEFTRRASFLARQENGIGRLPVPSQDGYMWYLAERMGLGIKRTNFRSMGWKHRSNMKNICAAAEEALYGTSR